MPETFGIEQFWINGVSTGIRGKVTVHMPGDVRATHMNMQGGIAGFSNNPRPASFELEINDRGDLSLDELNQMNGATVILVGRIGKSYALANAYRDKDPISVDVAEGNFEMTITGDYMPTLISGVA